MKNDEIIARIAIDVGDVDRGMFGVKDITIGMTEELFRKLFPKHFLLHGYDAELFGCKVKVFSCSGLWWIVGYEGTAEDDSQ